MALGIHYFYTLVEAGAVSFGALLDFLSLTDLAAPTHQFLGKTLSNDVAMANGLSNKFGTLIGIGFMAEYAETTWFCPLPSKGRLVLDSPSTKLTVTRGESGKSWPDYLAAPFNPREKAVGAMGAFYPLEFKGTGASIDFEDSRFQDWQEQSTNISVRSAGDKALALKSWILAFNYRCRDKPARHPSSTLLVLDPRVGPEEAPLPDSAAPIIREHLARQCRKLGLGGLAPMVLSGVRPEGSNYVPPVFRILHSRFSDRRYVGRFAAWGLNGELIAISHNPLLSSFPVGDIDLRVDAYFRGAMHAHIHIESRKATANQARIDVNVIGELSAGWTGSRVRSFILSLLQGQGNGVFIGQDAKMLRQCMRTPPTIELTGGEFDTPFEYFDPGAVDVGEEGLPAGAVQVLRNGSVLANPRLVELVEEDFWLQ